MRALVTRPDLQRLTLLGRRVRSAIVDGRLQSPIVDIGRAMARQAGASGAPVETWEWERMVALSQARDGRCGSRQRGG